MASEKKVESNKRNASKSTGPVTAAGKAAVSQNATTHGLLSRKLIIQGEDPAEFQALMQQLQYELHPVGTLELSLVERIAVGLWRQRRLISAESGQMQIQYIIGESQLSKAMAMADVPETRRTWARDFAKDTSSDVHVEAVAKQVAAALAKPEMTELKDTCPLVWLQLLRYTHEQEGPDHDAVLARMHRFFESTGQKYVEWLRDVKSETDQVLRMLAALATVRQAALIPRDADVLIRYQSALDNDVYKATRALREQQKFRLDTAALTAKPINPAYE